MPQNEETLSGNTLIMYNALTTLHEVLFDKDVTAEDIKQQLTSDDVMTTENKQYTVLFNAFGYDRIVLMKNDPTDEAFFTGMYQRFGGNTIVVSEQQSNNFIPNKYKDSELWQTLTYDLRDSILLFECSESSIYDFHEALPLALAMANGNKMYLLIEGTNGELNHESTIRLYQNVARAIRDINQPAYLRLNLNLMFKQGAFGLAIGEEQYTVGCLVKHADIGTIKTIPARYLKHSINLKMSFSTATFDFSIPMVRPYIKGEETALLECNGVLSPLAMTSWIDEMILHTALGSSLKVPNREQEDLFSMLGTDITTPKLLNRLKDIETINGSNVSDYTVEDKLDLLRRQGLYMYTHVLSRIWNNHTKNIYMQDIALLSTPTGLRVTVPLHDASVMSYDCDAYVYVEGKQIIKSFEHSQTMCPITQDYYMGGLSCKDVIETSGEFIKQALYFSYTRYYPWDNLAMSSEDIQYFTGSEARLPYINRLLSYNNVTIGRGYNNIPEHTMPLSIIAASVGLFGEINRRNDEINQRKVKIPL